jgi:hypothetical protein
MKPRNLNRPVIERPREGDEAVERGRRVREADGLETFRDRA